MARKYALTGAGATASGLATLVGGTKVVSSPAVTANSLIFLTHQNSLGTIGMVGVTARTAGVSFTITSLNLLDVSAIAWAMYEP